MASPDHEVTAGQRLLGAVFLGVWGLVAWAWVSRVESVLSVCGGCSAMQPWTAAGFGLLGLSLWIARLRPVVAGALVVLGSFVMIEYALQIDLFGFDRWLLSPWPTAGVVHVGRMSPGTACSFILAGAAWVLSDRRPQIAVLGLFGCLPTLVVYIVRGRPSPVVPDATIMAVHTAIAFTLWWSYVLFVTRTR